MDEPKQADALLSIGARVAAFLASLAVATLAVRYVTGVFRRSTKWLQEQLRNAIRKEIG